MPSIDLDADLPSPALGGDLPSPAFGIDLPSPAFGIDLPSPAFGIDLPSPAFGGDLPSVSSPGLPKARGFGEIDLPVAGAGLPAVAAGLPANTSPGLPSPVLAGLPVPATAGLPAPAAGLPSAVDDPFGATAGFGSPGGAPDPFGASGGGAFGEADPFGAAGGDPFGASGGDPFGAHPDGTDPFGDPSGGGDPFGAPPGGADPFGAAPGGLNAPAAPDPFGARRGGGGFPARSGRGDPGGEFAPAQEGDPEGEIVRKGGGSVAYGEVNLEDGGGGPGGVSIEGDGPEQVPDSGREFGALPTEGGAAPAALSRARAVPAAPGGAVAEVQAKRRRKRLRVVVATVVTTALAGGALTLVPGVGPFGAHFVVDQLRRGDYERLLAGASDGAHRDLGRDTYPDAEKALAEVEATAAQARRYKPLAAYTAFVGFSRTLRFGSEPAVYARAKVALDELAEATEVDKLELSRATKAAADGELAKARSALDRLTKLQPRDIDVAIVRGEVEIRAKDGARAVAAWTAASTIEKSARTAYGLARAKVLAGDAAGAEALARDVLTKSPNHVGARLLLAEEVWHGKRDEALATKLLSEVQAGSKYAGPEERIDTFTLLGEIHLSRGRITQAEQSFGEAIKLAELIKVTARASRALSGFGEALFRAGRYSQAIARFKAGAQADPDDVTAQVGVAKSSLLLERLEDAKEMLTKLRKSHPKHLAVAYWYGRVQESLGERKEAETAYRDAILAGKSDPEAVHAYISLAGVLSQVGQLDAARDTLAEARARLPASPALYKALGRVAMTQGRYPDGFEAFEKARSLDAEDVEARFLVGTALVRKREFDKALEIFDAVAKIDRDFPGLALERGILYQESGRTEEALREYEAALAKAPNDPDLMLKVGCGKADAGSGIEAEKLLKKVLEQRQNSAETHFCLGRALMAKHDLNDAIKAFERAIQIDPNHAEYHYYVGRACNEAGFIAKAAAALKKALELDQGLADAYWQRGVLRVRQTRPKDAIEDLTKALSLRPSRYEAHADLALAYYDVGREDLALAEWQRAIAANPKEPTWRFHYGKLLSLRLQNGPAAEQLKKALELAAEREGPALPWLSEGHRLAAHSLGMNPAAIPHWQAFLRMGAANSPYRAEAVAALRRLGAKTDED